MTATPDHVEQLVDTVYNNDSVVRVTSRVMSSSELADIANKVIEMVGDNKVNVSNHNLLSWS